MLGRMSTNNGMMWPGWAGGSSVLYDVAWKYLKIETVPFRISICLKFYKCLYGARLPRNPKDGKAMFILGGTFETQIEYHVPSKVNEYHQIILCISTLSIP